MSLVDIAKKRLMQQRVPQSAPQSTGPMAISAGGKPPEISISSEMRPSGAYPDKPASQTPAMPNSQMQSDQQVAMDAMRRRAEAGQGITGQTAGGNPMMAQQQIKPSSQMDAQKQALQVQQNQANNAQQARQAQAKALSQRRPIWR